MEKNRQNRRAFSRALALLLCFALLFAIAGCGSSDDEEISSGLNQSSAGSSSTGSADVEDAADFGTGRFVENARTVPDTDYLYTLGIRDGDLYINGRGGRWKSVDKGDSWEECPAVESELVDQLHEQGYDPEQDRFFYGNDGTAVVIACQTVDLDEPIGWFDFYNKCAYVVIEPDGSEHEVVIKLPTYEFFAMPGEPIDENREPPEEYATELVSASILADGTLLGIGLSGNLYHVDLQTGEILHTIEPEKGKEFWGAKIAFTDKTLLAVFNDIEPTVRMFDLESWEERSDTDALEDFLSENVELTDDGVPVDRFRDYIMVSAGIGEEAFYLMDNTGAYRYMPGGVSVEKLVESSVTSLGLKDVSGLNITVTEDYTIYALFSKQGDGGTPEWPEMEYFLYSYEYDSDAPLVPAQKLKVYTFMDSDEVDQAIAIYKRDHDVLVEKEVALGWGAWTWDQQADAQRQLNVELMSDNAPDVIFLDGMPVNTYTSKGMLLDISDVIEEAGEGREFIRNITDIYAQDGQICAVPAGFIQSFIVGSRENLDKVNGLDSLVATVEELRAADPDISSITGYHFAAGPMSTTVGMLDPNWLRDGARDWDVITNYFDAVSRIMAADNDTEEGPPVDEDGVIHIFGPIYEPADFGRAIEQNMSVIELRPLNTMAGLVSLFGIEEEHPELDLDYKPLEDNGICCAEMKHVTGISARTAVPDLAKEFVKTMLGQEMQKFLYKERSGVDTQTPIPVDFGVIRQRYEPEFGETFEEDYTVIRGMNFEDMEQMKMIRRYPTQEELDTLLGYFQKVNGVALDQENRIDRAIIMNILDYTDGNKTLDEAVEDARSQIELYLAEQ